MKRCVLAMTLVFGGVAAAQQDSDWSKIEVKLVPVTGGVSMLVGEGGNIGVTSGKEGIFLIDDRFEPLLPRIRAAVKTPGDGPIRSVVNTDFHGDHTGSDARLHESGAVIIAHENVRRRLGLERVNPGTKERTPPRPPEAWPLALVAQGKTLEQVIAARPTAQWDATGLVGPEVFVSFGYRSLTEPRPAGSR